jgi:hypothetical protein
MEPGGGGCMRTKVQSRVISGKHQGLFEIIRLNGLFLCAVPVVFFAILATLSVDGSLRIVGMAGLLAPLIIFIVFAREKYVGRAIMLVLGFVPFASVPVLGMQVQWLVGLIAFYWVAMAVGLLRRSVRTSCWSAGLLAVLLMFIVSLVSFIATQGQNGSADNIEFVKWAAAFSLVLVLAQQDRLELQRLCRLFVLATSAGAVYALICVLMPGGSALLNLLSIVGYQRNASDSQAYFLQNGEKVAARLAGAFVDPNIAAMFFFVALVLAFVFFAGKMRIAIGAVLVISLAATLSRGGMLALAVVVLVFVFQNRRHLGKRLVVLLSSLGLAATVLFFPVTRQRLLSSFGQEDVGSVDRLEAIERFPEVMSQNWLWGLGWGRPEFRDASVSYAVNMVANAPLGAIYRSGLLVGVAFLVILVTMIWGARRLIVTRRPSAVAAGGMILGFVAAIQTGYGVITIMPMTALMSVVILVVLRPDISAPCNGDDLGEVPTEIKPLITPAGALSGRRYM